MSSVVELPAPYIATRTAAQATPANAEATPSVLEGHRVSAWSALWEALREDIPVMPSDAAISEALAVLELLPSRMPPPEPIIEDSGTIAWVWDGQVGKSLALAVNGAGTIQLSAVIDGHRSWNTTPLLDRLTKEDLEVLARFCPLHA